MAVSYSCYNREHAQVELELLESRPSNGNDALHTYMERLISSSINLPKIIVNSTIFVSLSIPMVNMSLVSRRSSFLYSFPNLIRVKVQAPSGTWRVSASVQSGNNNFAR